MKFSFCDSLHVLNSITSVFGYAYHEVNMHRIILLVISLHFWLQKSASLCAFQNTLCKSFSWKWPGLVLNFSMKKLFACYSTQTIGFKISAVLSCSLPDIDIQFHHLKDQMNKNHAKCSFQKTTLKENFVLLGVKILNFTQFNLLPWGYRMFVKRCSLAPQVYCYTILAVQGKYAAIGTMGKNLTLTQLQIIL